MARPVVFMKKVYYGALIRSYLVSGSYVDSEVYEGEILNDFSFVENGEVKTITGKLKKVNVNFYHISNALTSMKTSLLAQDARVLMHLVNTNLLFMLFHQEKFWNMTQQRK